MYRLIFLLLTAWCLQSESPQAPLRKGKDYALFFAVSDYSQESGLLPLPNSIKDAEQVAQVLQQHYGFETEVVKNPTYDRIEAKLKEYEKKFRDGIFAKDGQLLIYFSGHGVKEADNGYFLPADVKPTSLLRTALPYTTWRPVISNIPCQHILVAIDACYSVTFDPNWQSKTDPRFTRKGELSESERVLENHKQHPNRTFFTSDGKEDVVPGRSNFARKLVEGLLHYKTNAPFMTSSQLFANFVQNAQPTPRAGHFEGDHVESSFLFFPINTGTIEPEAYAARQRDMNAYKTLQQNPSLEGCIAYLNTYKTGLFVAEVTTLQYQLQEDQDWEYYQLKKDYNGYLHKYSNGRYRSEAERLKSSNTSAILPPVPTNNSLESYTLRGHEMIPVEGGSFIMGCQDGRDTDCDTDEKPAHKVQITTFWISRHEVTNEQFAVFLNAKGNKEEGGSTWYEEKEGGGGGHILKQNGKFVAETGYANHPVMEVSWYGAVAYCKWLSEQSGKAFRLPSEAEWEYAARGGNKSKGYLYAGSNDPKLVAWHDANAKGSTQPVGRLQSNELGLYDMSGNIWEWVQDCWHSSYQNAPSTGSPWLENNGGDCARRVLRGGSWNDLTRYLRAANRGRIYSSIRGNNNGFRVAQG